MTIEIGTRVEAGEGEEHDTGCVIGVYAAGEDARGQHGMAVAWALVSWDSGVTTPCAIDRLSEV